MQTSPPLAVALAALVAAAAPARAADAAHPTVVELYQSQGCSSCPPANANLIALADRPDVLALSFHVTYWDQLGWKDTFDSPAYTARQWAYAHALQRTEVATPQVVINGRHDLVGSDAGELARAIRAGDRGVSGPALAFGPGKVTVSGRAPAHPATVWLVRYDPRVVQVAIRRGENGGKTLPHRNVVKGLTRLGDWTSAAQTYALPTASDPALRTAVLVQEGPGGAILAAGRG